MSLQLDCDEHRVLLTCVSGGQEMCADAPNDLPLNTGGFLDVYNAPLATQWFLALVEAYSASAPRRQSCVECGIQLMAVVCE